MPILIDKDADKSAVSKERTLSPTAQLFSEGCQELAKQLPR
jgi:hypothetical protein